MPIARSEDERPSPAAWIALAVLTGAYTLSYLDRTIITLLVGPIRADLELTDTQFSLLHGLAFAVFYTVLGIPIGHLADRQRRDLIVSAGIFLWSLMTALCGLARTFWQLFAARVGVGIGEAALSPAAYSLVTDLFPRAQLGRALAVYNLGIYVGSGLTYFLGGWLVEHLEQRGPFTLPWDAVLQPWQQVFVLVGAPGLLVGGLALRYLCEPRQFALVGRSTARLQPLAPLLKGNAAYLSAHFAAFALLSMMSNGYSAWLPEFFLRTHGWSKTYSGIWIGSAVIGAGITGVMLGGFLTDWLHKRGDRAAALTSALLTACALLPFSLFPNIPDASWSYAGMVGFVLFSSACFGPAITALQMSTAADARARVSALYLFVVNLAGIGLGGTAIALISDYVLQDEARLGDAMTVVGCGGVLLSLPLLVLARRGTK